MYWWGIPIALTILAILGAALRSAAKASTPLVLLADWAACTAVVFTTHDDYPVLFFIAADYMAAVAIFMSRRSHWQTAILVTYAAELVCHAAYAISGMGSDPTFRGYWMLDKIAWVQVALIGGWIGTELIGVGSRAFGFVPGRGHHATRVDALAESEGE